MYLRQTGDDENTKQKEQKNNHYVHDSQRSITSDKYYEDGTECRADKDTQLVPLVDRFYVLCRLPSVQTRASTIPEATAVHNKPRLLVALKFSEKTQLLKPIKERFEALVDLRTWIII